ncbi:MAG: hypothetical protein CMP23_11090 [Rickettsiales bacterium]|nr:hypothetical protein [Rickettsiales bacterium]
MTLMAELDEEQERAVKEGLEEDELALFDLLKKEELTSAERERLKLASRSLLSLIKDRLAMLDRFWEQEQTKAEVETLIVDEIYKQLPSPPFSDEEKELAANAVYDHVPQQAISGEFTTAV